LSAFFLGFFGLIQVTGIYSASAWRHINEHLHDVLGKQCADLGDAQGCLQHSAALLDCGHRQAAAQAHYMARFFEAVQAAGVAGVSGCWRVGFSGRVYKRCTMV
jgi:hypothetical protein